MDTTPHTSIVIPTFSRGASLARCLAALSALHVPAGGFEVVVVDDGSPEPLDDVVAPFRERLELTLHRKTNGGPAGARNRGVEIARGRWIVFTDDDCCPRPDWLVILVAALEARPQAMMGGQTENALPGHPWSETSQLLVDYLYDAGRADNGDLAFITSNNMALARDAFRSLGGFDESYPLAAGEDRDFCDRWIASGRVIRQQPRALVQHFHALSLAGFWRQHRNYGRGAWRLRQGRARASAEPIAFERLGFYTNLLAYPVTRRHQRALRHALGFGIAQLATAVGLVEEAWSSDDR